MTTTRTEFYCTTCGGTNVYSDAFASMNDMDDVITYDEKFCMNCEESCSVGEREVKVIPKEGISSDG